MTATKTELPKYLEVLQTMTSAGGNWPLLKHPTKRTVVRVDEVDFEVKRANFNFLVRLGCIERVDEYRGVASVYRITDAGRSELAAYLEAR